MSSEAHIPVLLDQVLEVLAPGPGQTLLDCTVGLGGHAEAVASTIGPTGVAILNDADPANLAAAAERIGRLPSPPRVETLRGNFAQAPRRLVELGLAADMVLADLGFASPQMDDPSRGFSFRGDGPLDMRFDPEGPVTAATLVNALSERELGEILRDYGEERLWRQVARKLVAEREASPISTTSRFASIVRSVVGGRNGQSRIDPATRSFQALRIAVNDELASLESLLESVRRVADAGPARQGSPAWLAPGARVAVISFHSLEDRLVKRSFAELVSRGRAASLTRKPMTATESEIHTNPRARSAKLRAIALSV